MEDFNIPKELETELVALRKRDRIYTWILIGLIGVVTFLGVRIYLKSNIDNSYVDSSLYTQTGSPLANTNGAAGGVGGGCGSSGGGGCCGGGGGSQVDPAQLEKQALAEYKAQYGDKVGIKAKLIDFGCHQQIDVMDKDNNLLKSYEYRGGQLSVVGQ